MVSGGRNVGAGRAFPGRVGRIYRTVFSGVNAIARLERLMAALTEATEPTERIYAGAVPIAQPESRAPEPCGVKRRGSQPASRNSPSISSAVK